ncbi:MAG: hypothetical protein P4L46_00860 [Fimbriimonas sp.]|nr:hypothetical protein [Fimbriimonas sp.]
MHLLFVILGFIAGIVGTVCWVLILIEAFKDEIWKGVVFLLCGFYGLYYALFEFEHENKWPIVIGAFGGGCIAAGISRLG